MSRDEQGFLTSAVKTLFAALKYLSPMGHLQVTPATSCGERRIVRRRGCSFGSKNFYSRRA